MKNTSSKMRKKIVFHTDSEFEPDSSEDDNENESSGEDSENVFLGDDSEIVSSDDDSENCEEKVPDEEMVTQQQTGETREQERERRSSHLKTVSREDFGRGKRTKRSPSKYNFLQTNQLTNNLLLFQE